jgi:hypothetical protein
MAAAAAASAAAAFFFSSALIKALTVMRRDLLGLHMSGSRGEWLHTGHASGREAWQCWQMDESQHWSLKALTASLLQVAHRSFVGISDWVSELKSV